MMTNSEASDSRSQANQQVNQEPPELQPSNEHRIGFHMAEFSALKSEIAELVKVASSNLQYALAVSGAITTWLMSIKVSGPSDKLLFPWASGYLKYGFLLPLLLSIAFGTLALAAYLRIKEKGAYLKAIEDQLRAQCLGWERRFQRRRRTLGGLYGAVWLALGLFNLAVACLALR